MEQRTEEQLVKENLGLVGMIVARYGIDHNERDDFFQIGCIGLCKAVETFESSKNIKFSTYATQCINNEILMEFRIRYGKNGKKGKVMSNIVYLSSPLNMHNDNEGLRIEDTVFDDKQNIETKKEIIDMLEYLLRYIANVMDPRERYILLCRAGGISQEEIASEYGITQSFISRLEKRATSNLEKAAKSDQRTEGRYQMRLVDGEIQLSFEGDKELMNNALSKINLDLHIQKFAVEYSESRLTIKVPADADSLPFIGKILKVVEE